MLGCHFKKSLKLEVDYAQFIVRFMALHITDDLEWLAGIEHYRVKVHLSVFLLTLHVVAFLGGIK